MLFSQKVGMSMSHIIVMHISFIIKKPCNCAKTLLQLIVRVISAYYNKQKLKSRTLITVHIIWS